MKQSIIIFLTIISITAIAIAVKLNADYNSEVLANRKLKNELAIKDSIIAIQRAEYLNLNDVIIERDYELSFWGHILDQLATNHPKDANKIAKVFGFKWIKVKQNKH